MAVNHQLRYWPMYPYNVPYYTLIQTLDSYLQGHVQAYNTLDNYVQLTNQTRNTINEIERILNQNDEPSQPIHNPESKPYQFLAFYNEQYNELHNNLKSALEDINKKLTALENSLKNVDANNDSTTIQLPSIFDLPLVTNEIKKASSDLVQSAYNLQKFCETGLTNINEQDRFKNRGLNYLIESFKNKAIQISNLCIDIMNVVNRLKGKPYQQKWLTYKAYQEQFQSLKQSINQQVSPVTSATGPANSQRSQQSSAVANNNAGHDENRIEGSISPQQNNAHHEQNVSMPKILPSQDKHTIENIRHCTTQLHKAYKSLIRPKQDNAQIDNTINQFKEAHDYLENLHQDLRIQYKTYPAKNVAKKIFNYLNSLNNIYNLILACQKKDELLKQMAQGELATSKSITQSRNNLLQKLPNELQVNKNSLLALLYEQCNKLDETLAIIQPIWVYKENIENSSQFPQNIISKIIKHHPKLALPKYQSTTTDHGYYEPVHQQVENTIKELWQTAAIERPSDEANWQAQLTTLRRLENWIRQAQTVSNLSLELAEQLTHAPLKSTVPRYITNDYGENIACTLYSLSTYLQHLEKQTQSVTSNHDSPYNNVVKHIKLTEQSLIRLNFIREQLTADEHGITQALSSFLRQTNKPYYTNEEGYTETLDEVVEYCRDLIDIMSFGNIVGKYTYQKRHNYIQTILVQATEQLSLLNDLENFWQNVTQNKNGQPVSPVYKLLTQNNSNYSELQENYQSLEKRLKTNDDQINQYPLWVEIRTSFHIAEAFQQAIPASQQCQECLNAINKLVEHIGYDKTGINALTYLQQLSQYLGKLAIICEHMEQNPDDPLYEAATRRLWNIYTNEKLNWQQLTDQCSTWIQQHPLISKNSISQRVSQAQTTSTDIDLLSNMHQAFCRQHEDLEDELRSLLFDEQEFVDMSVNENPAQRVWQQYHQLRSKLDHIHLEGPWLELRNTFELAHKWQAFKQLQTDNVAEIHKELQSIINHIERLSSQQQSVIHDIKSALSDLNKLAKEMALHDSEQHYLAALIHQCSDKPTRDECLQAMDNSIDFYQRNREALDNNKTIAQAPSVNNLLHRAQWVAHKLINLKDLDSQLRSNNQKPNLAECIIIGNQHVTADYERRLNELEPYLPNEIVNPPWLIFHTTFQYREELRDAFTIKEPYELSNQCAQYYQYLSSWEAHADMKLPHLKAGLIELWQILNLNPTRSAFDKLLDNYPWLQHHCGLTDEHVNALVNNSFHRFSQEDWNQAQAFLTFDYPMRNAIAQMADQGLLSQKENDRRLKCQQWLELCDRSPGNMHRLYEQADWLPTGFAIDNGYNITELTTIKQLSNEGQLHQLIIADEGHLLRCSQDHYDPDHETVKQQRLLRRAAQNLWQILHGKIQHIQSAQIHINACYNEHKKRYDDLIDKCYKLVDDNERKSRIEPHIKPITDETEERDNLIGRLYQIHSQKGLALDHLIVNHTLPFSQQILQPVQQLVDQCKNTDHINASIKNDTQAQQAIANIDHILTYEPYRPALIIYPLISLRQSLKPWWDIGDPIANELCSAMETIIDVYHPQHNNELIESENKIYQKLLSMNSHEAKDISAWQWDVAINFLALSETSSLTDQQTANKDKKLAQLCSIRRLSKLCQMYKEAADELDETYLSLYEQNSFWGSLISLWRANNSKGPPSSPSEQSEQIDGTLLNFDDDNLNGLQAGKR